jgi:hypothetical protein
MQDNSRKKVDALLLLAKTAIGDRRRRSWPAILATLAVLLILLTVIVWLFLPSPALPDLLLAAFDTVALPNEAVTVAARLEPREQPLADVRLAGLLLYFQESKSPELLGKVATNAGGLATLEPRFPEQPHPLEIIVRFPGEENRRKSAEARGRVFIWPADTQVLVIDADHVLANIDEPKFWVTNNLDVRSLPGAAQVLQKARSRFRVVYLSGGADRVPRYNKLLAWLQRTAPASEQFPEGPLLAPASQSAVDRATFERETLKHLRVSFAGTVVGIAGRAEESEIFHQAGLKTWQLGGSDDSPKDVTAVKSWKELETPLTK